MSIKIGENYSITFDSLNVILNQKVVSLDETGEVKKTYFKHIGFYPNLEQACLALLEKEIKLSEVESIDGLIQVIRKTQFEIIESIRNPKGSKQQV